MVVANLFSTFLRAPHRHADVVQLIFKTVFTLSFRQLVGSVVTKTCTIWGVLVQGKGMGFGWIAYGFGLAFFFPIFTLGYISAHLNPAMCLGLLAVGEINGQTCIALSACEFAGMFLGALFVYVRPFQLVIADMSDNVFCLSW